MSSGVLDRLRRRSKRPVEIDGEKFYLRSLTSGELRQVETVADSAARADAMLGLTIVEADGSRVFPTLPGETMDQFAQRMREDLEQVEEATKIELLMAMQNNHKVPSVETLAKN